MGPNENCRDKGGAFFPYAALAYGALALIITCLAAIFIQNIWMVGDTKLFFRMTELILSGGTPYVDFMDPKPPLMFFILTVPAMLGRQLYGGLMLVGLCNFLSALVVMRMGERLYGRLPGFACGLIFMAMTSFTVYGGNVLAMAGDSGFEAVGLVAADGYRSPDALMAVANIVLSVCMLASLLPLALLGFYREHGPSENYFLAAGLCFVATLMLRQYLHYWPFALPFLALLCAGAFRRPSRG
jgi:Na+/melibiose symporter-like transporter